MKCFDCGTVLETKRENYRYDDCGLPYVVLHGVEVSRCPKCGYEEVAIKSIENLHKLIAWRLAEKDSRLTAEEARFLRKYVGYSSGDFAEVLGVTVETVSRWENGVRPIGPVHDRLLRMLAVSKEPTCTYPIENLRRIDVTKAQPERVDATESVANGWETVLA